MPHEATERQSWPGAANRDNNRVSQMKAALFALRLNELPRNALPTEASLQKTYSMPREDYTANIWLHPAVLTSQPDAFENQILFVVNRKTSFADDIRWHIISTRNDKLDLTFLCIITV